MLSMCSKCYKVLPAYSECNDCRDIEARNELNNLALKMTSSPNDNLSSRDMLVRVLVLMANTVMLGMGDRLDWSQELIEIGIAAASSK